MTTSLKRTGIVTTVAVAALVAGLVGTALASPPSAASGTITQDAITGFDIRFAGPNVIVTQSTAGSISGTLDGDFEDTTRVVIHPNGRFTAKGTLTCQCTVEGEVGTLEFVVSDTGKEIDGVPTFEGRYVIVGASGELSGLRGVLQMDGTVDPTTGLSSINYSGQVHTHP